VCSALFEALVAERFCAARMGRRLTVAERRSLTIRYSLALAGISLPLVGWLAASKATPAQLSSAGYVTSYATALVAAGLLVGLVVYTALRYALMTFLSPRPS
jgi:hypothetical protein